MKRSELEQIDMRREIIAEAGRCTEHNVMERMEIDRDPILELLATSTRQ